MPTDPAGRILLWRSTARTWARVASTARLYVHLVEVGSSKALCGRGVVPRVVERDQPKRLCVHCDRLSK